MHLANPFFFFLNDMHLANLTVIIISQMTKITNNFAPYKNLPKTEVSSDALQGVTSWTDCSKTNGIKNKAAHKTEENGLTENIIHFLEAFHTPLKKNWKK